MRFFGRRMDFVREMGRTILALKHRMELSMVSPEFAGIKYGVSGIPHKLIFSRYCTETIEYYVRMRRTYVLLLDTHSNSLSCCHI